MAALPTAIATASVITAGASAVAAYLSQRFSNRRSAAADALVLALRDFQRSRFLLDLSIDDHRSQVLEPLNAWRGHVAAEANKGLVESDAEGSPTAAQILAKFDEILLWRMQEREARIRFAAVARAGDIAKFASYHHRVHCEAANWRMKRVVPRPPGYDDAIEALIRTIVSLRVPSILRPINHFARKTPVIHRALVRDEDIRMLVADYEL